jgi:hypothetical protein
MCSGENNYINWEDIDSNWESIFLGNDLADWIDIQYFNENFIEWDKLDMNWEIILNGDLLMCWENISLITQVEKILKCGSSYGREREIKNPWKKLSEKINEDKVEKFIKIYCTVNNIKYEKEVMIKKDISINVSKLEKVFNTIKVKINM